MDPNQPDESTKLERYIRRCRALVDSHGHMIHSVATSTTTPTYSYTIGRTRKGAPELIVIGLAPDIATGFLNVVARRLDETPIADDTDIHRVAQVPLRLRSIDAAAAIEHIRLIEVVLEQRPVGLRQIVWPDEWGRFPGTPNYDHRISQNIDQLTR